MRSTDANLQFLEAQLDEYLHEHEDDGESLWVTKKGFRMPLKKSIQHIDKNMKFIERQLEEYLHEHETVVDEDACTVTRPTGERLYEPDFTGTIYIQPFPNPYGSPAHGSDWYDDGRWRYTGSASHLTVSTADPHSASNHLRFEFPAATNEIVAPIMKFEDLCDPAPTTHRGDNHPFSARVRDGDTISWSYWAQASEPYEVRIALYWWDLTGDPGFEQLFRSDQVTLGTSYQQLSDSAVNTKGDGYVVAFVELIGRSFGSSLNDRIVDVDTPSLTVTGDDPSGATLYTNKVGFRFPRQDMSTLSAIDENMKFLEMQLTEYLHKHEVGYVAPPEE